MTGQTPFDEIRPGKLKELVSQRMQGARVRHRMAQEAADVEYELNVLVPQFLSKHKDDIVNYRARSKTARPAIATLEKIVNSGAQDVTQQELVYLHGLFSNSQDVLPASVRRDVKPILKLCESLYVHRPMSAEDALSHVWQKYADTVQVLLKSSLAEKAKKGLQQLHSRFTLLDGREESQKTDGEMMMRWDNYMVSKRRLDTMVSRPLHLKGLQNVPRDVTALCNYICKFDPANQQDAKELSAMAGDFNTLVKPALDRLIASQGSAQGVRT